MFGVRRVVAFAIIAATVAFSACGSSPPEPFNDGSAVFRCRDLDGERYIEVRGEWELASEILEALETIEVDESKRAFAAWVKDCAG